LKKSQTSNFKFRSPQEKPIGEEDLCWSEGELAMKCPNCGAENPATSSTCDGCGKPLVATRREAAKSYAKPSARVDHNEIARKMKLDYLHGAKDRNERAWDGILSLLSHFQKPQMDLNALLFDAANIIQKLHGIANVGIGLKSASDGLFRYEVLVGFRSDTEAAEKKLAYTEKQFSDDTEYRGTMIGKISKLYLAEDLPYKDDEIESYDRAVLLGMRRLSPSDSLEADYIDIWIQGVNGRLLGWIEISGTRAAKLPDILAIKQIEVIASIIGAALVHRGAA